MNASFFSPYRTRAIRPLGVLDVSSGLKMKGYEIHHSRAQPPLVDSEVIAGAQACVTEVAAAEISKTNHHGIGFYIVHQGSTANWLLIDWWTGDVFLHHKLFCSTAADPANFSARDGSLTCCTWEFVAMAHERNAWVESRLSDSADPLAVYAADFLSTNA
jgi:hypothetical protein